MRGEGRHARILRIELKGSCRLVEGTVAPG